MIGRALASLATSLATARVPAAPIGVARVMVGLGSLWQWRITPRVFGRYADPALIHFPNVTWLPGPSADAAPYILGAWLVAALCFTLGWRTRPAGVVLASLQLWSVLYDEQTYDNHSYLLSILVFLLTLTDAGAALSLDARGRAAHATVPAWGAFLLKAQLSVVYGFAFINKLNAFYLAGGIMMQGVWPLHALEPLVGYRPVLALAVVLAWVSVLVEGWLAVAMWHARWRPGAIALGFLLHAGINASMDQYFGLAAFTLAMWGTYLPFLDARPNSRVVVWEEGCASCAVWVRWLRRLDWMGVHNFGGARASAPGAGATPAPSGEALQLLAPEGRHAGFAAIGRVLELQPLSFVWAPLLRFPLLRHWGDRVFERYALRPSGSAP